MSNEKALVRHQLSNQLLATNDIGKISLAISTLTPQAAFESTKIAAYNFRDRKQVVEIIYLLIKNLQQSLSLKEPMTQTQMEEAAILFSKEFEDLTVEEIAVAFREVKTGKYGVIYGSLDTVKLGYFIRMYRASDERLAYIENRHKIPRDSMAPGNPVEVKQKVNQILSDLKPELKPVKKTSALSEWMAETKALLRDVIISCDVLGVMEILELSEALGELTVAELAKEIDDSCFFGIETTPLPTTEGLRPQFRTEFSLFAQEPWLYVNLYEKEVTPKTLKQNAIGWRIKK